jgi:ABC-2 type transport system permease protein
MMRLIRSAYVIGRRDFAATVLSKAFIFFLIGPLFPLLLGGIFGSIGARVATQTESAVVAVVASDADYDRISAARERVADALAGQMIVKLVHYAPEADSAAQELRLLATKKPPIRAVLTGGLTKPHLTGAVAEGDPTSGQISLILSEAKAAPTRTVSSVRVTETHTASGILIKNRALTAQIGQMLLFFLTILLSGMVLSQLIEEKSNKIIEVVAAAVPIDALFIGKLFAMLAASVVGIIVWVGSGALLIDLVKEGGVQTLPSPAVGWPAFLILGILYFAMNYLLFGAVFLTIGAQAATVREVQTLSMPVTFGQVLIFGFAATAVGAPNSTEAMLAAVVPLSSPMVMLARAAEQPELWPHVVAFAWQGLWVVGILHVGAKMFRKTVLKSGPAVRWWRLRRA